MVVLPSIPAIQEAKVEGSWSEASLGKVSRRFCLKKQIKTKRTRGVTQVVEQLPSKQEALSSIPTTKKKKKEKLENTFIIICCYVAQVINLYADFLSSSFDKLMFDYNSLLVLLDFGDRLNISLTVFSFYSVLNLFPSLGCLHRQAFSIILKSSVHEFFL
jgi:hypothetical protein